MCSFRLKEVNMKKHFWRNLITLPPLFVLFVQPALAAEPNSNGTIGLVQFSHHDLGWHSGSFEAEANYTCKEINSALDRMRTEPDYTWTTEYSLMISYYLDKYPDRYDELAQRVQEGRFDMGAGYSQPQTSFVSNETLVRQFILGKKWTQEMFPGSKAGIYYNTDIPGLGTQMPQILKKAGVDYLYLSRSWNFDDYKDNEYKLWKSPDGTGINTLFMDQYGRARFQWDLWRNENPGKDYLAERALPEYMKAQKEMNLGNNMPFVVGHDIMMPNNYRSRIDSWNQAAQEKGLPVMKYQTMQQALEAAFAGNVDFSKNTLEGEWPNKWFYENGASDNNAFMNQRDAGRFLTAAETLAVLRATITGNFAEYPAAKIEEIWREIEFSCHGYAPAACVTKFRKHYQSAFDAAKGLYDENLEWLLAQINVDLDKGLPVAVYNELSWERDDVVIMDKPNGIGKVFKLVDENNKEVAYQLAKGDRIVFVAEAVPSMGYKTYYLKNNVAPAKYAGNETVGNAWSSKYANDYYELTPATDGGGLTSIIDKENNSQSLFATDKFLIGEVVDFKYTGLGAGEQRQIWQPQAPASLKDKFSGWTCVEAGPVRTVFETRAASTDRGPIALRVTTYQNLKKVDFDIKLENLDNKEQRQIRLMFPVGTGSMFNKNPEKRGSDKIEYYYVDNSDVKVTYEVPFGAVTVGDEVQTKFSKFNDNTKIGGNAKQATVYADQEGMENYGGSTMKKGSWDLGEAAVGNRMNEGTRPREVQNWIRASGNTDDFSVTISTFNLGWDYQDATRNPVKTPVLQPVLISNTLSCNWSYKYWTQAGEHSFHFSMTSGTANNVDGHKMSIAVNSPLDARVQTKTSASPSLPESYQGFGVDKSNIIVTAIKKAEDDNHNIIVRFYEAEGKANTGDATISLPNNTKVKAAKEVNLIERDTGKNFTYTDNKVKVSTSAWSIETAKLTVNGIDLVPMAPKNLHVRTVAGVAKLSWINKEPDVTYTVEQRVPDGAWQPLAKIEGNELTIELPAGGYFFRVRSEAGDKKSEWVYTKNELRLVGMMDKAPHLVSSRSGIFPTRG